MERTLSRLGDGSVIQLTESELRCDLEEGTKDAATAGKVDPLTEDELDHLFDIYSSPVRVTGVEPGREIVLSYDSPTLKVRRVGIDSGRIHALQMYEKLLGADTQELSHVDYSFKPVKPIVTYEQPILEQALLVTTIPLFYGAMPNLGTYTRPDGPVANPAELLPMGKIREARASHEETVEHAIKDMVFVASALYESGADGINFDTTGAAGDPDFLAALRACEILKQKYPQMCIELGMAGEFVLGMHGELAYDGMRLAGLYPHEQVKLAAKAGVTIFGPVVNTNTSKSCPWNISRAITLMKACGEVSEIPIHVNMGMGVGGIPVTDHPQIDAVSKASRAMVELVRLDGLQAGVGDPLAMACTHAIASGMGGMRTAGDLVARLEMTEGMKINEAKKYVAGKLGVSVTELADPVVMTEIREDLGIGLISPLPNKAGGIEAKFRIAELLGIEINCVKCFGERVGTRL